MTDHPGSPTASDQSRLAFDVLYADTTRRLDRVAEGLAEVDRELGHGPEDRSYRLFVEVLRLAVQGARAVLVEKRAEVGEWADDSARETHRTVRNVAIRIGEQLEEHLRLLRIPRSPRLAVFAAPLTRLTKSFMPNVELLFFPWAFDGYRGRVYDRRFVRELDTVLEENLDRLYGREIKFLQLLHPSLRTTDLFHHAVFAHEIAHTALRLRPPGDLVVEYEGRKGDGAATKATGQPSYRNLATDAVPLPTELEAERGKLLDWFDEIACDLIAMRLLGPSFLIGFAEVTAANRTLESGDRYRTHPPPGIRYAFLESELRDRLLDGRMRERYGQLLVDFARSYEPPQSVAGLDFSSPSAASGDEAVEELEKAWLEETIEEFKGLVDALLPKEIQFDVATFNEDLPLIERLAAAGIPPAEKLGIATELPRDERLRWSQPIEWRSILNGVLLWHKAANQGEPGSDRERAIKLALGAIDLSEFQREAQLLQREADMLALPASYDP
jgi:hypothetical protein